MPGAFKPFDTRLVRAGRVSLSDVYSCVYHADVSRCAELRGRLAMLAGESPLVLELCSLLAHQAQSFQREDVLGVLRAFTTPLLPLPWPLP